MYRDFDFVSQNRGVTWVPVSPSFTWSILFLLGHACPLTFLKRVLWERWAPLEVALVGTARPPLAAASALSRTKAAPTTSSPKACRVVMLSNSLVVFGCSRPSS
jgi:hypothetical protein